MQTRASRFVRLFAGFSFALFAAGCGGSVGQDPGATHTGGAAGTGGGGAGSGGKSGMGGNGGSSSGCAYQGQHYAEGQTWGACGECSCHNGNAVCSLNLCGCDYGGTFHAVGDSFPSTDGCNSCTCESSGQVMCTEMACSKGCDVNGVHYDPGQTWTLGTCNSCTCMPDGTVACTGAFCPASCTYGGQTYGVGDTFPSLDGCNTCTCNPPDVNCTKMACACDPTKEWWRNYLTTDPLSCATVKYSCPANTTPFENQCGCGCEEDQSCPQVINCMPPAPDCNALESKCPFSSVAN